jgi:type I restriction enzyme S subunit
VRRQRLKYLVSINHLSLDERTDPDYEFLYLDIGAVGRGVLVEEPQHVTFAEAPSRARRIVKAGDTIISTVRTYLRAVWPVNSPTENLIVSTGFAVLTPRPGMDPRYLGWLAESDVVVESVVARSVGVSYPAINASEIGDIPVQIPPIQTQRAIADYLDAETARIDALIEKKQRMIERLEERLGVLVSEQMCAERIGRAMDLPVDWRVVPLRRCFLSMDYGIGDASKPSGTVGVLGMGNVEPGHIVGEPGGFTDLDDDYLLLKPDDLLFNRTNSLALVGKVARWMDTGEPTTFASYLVRLRVSGLTDSRYMNYLLNTAAVLGAARSMALPSIGQANLNPNRYATMRVPLPPIEQQRRIVGTLDAEASICHFLTSRLETQLSLLAEHRQALITAAVTREFNIPGVAA